MIVLDVSIVPFGDYKCERKIRSIRITNMDFISDDEAGSWRWYGVYLHGDPSKTKDLKPDFRLKHNRRESVEVLIMKAMRILSRKIKSGKIEEVDCVPRTAMVDMLYKSIVGS